MGRCGVGPSWCKKVGRHAHRVKSGARRQIPVSSAAVMQRELPAGVGADAVMTDIAVTRLVQLATSGDNPEDVRRQALWVLGHHGEASVASVLRDVAYHRAEAVSVRAVAAYAWYRLVPGDVLGGPVPGADVWPSAVMLPLLWDRVDAEWADAHRNWTRQVAAGRPDVVHQATLALGDYSNEVVSWAFMADQELTTLGLPAPGDVDWSQAYAAGSQWALDPPGDFFGRRAVIDAHRWAEAVLRQRIALLRYHGVRQWEAWLRETLGDVAEAGPAAPVFTPIALPRGAPAAEATTLLVLGAFAIQGGLNHPAEVSSRLSSAAAALHMNTAETYQNAQVSAWHVGALTGRLALRFVGAP